MNYKKKYLKYKLKYLTAKKLYGGMEPGPQQAEAQEIPDKKQQIEDSFRNFIYNDTELLNLYNIVMNSTLLIETILVKKT